MLAVGKSQKKEVVTEVVLIAHYMSGDRNTLASAMHLSGHIIVGVVGPNDQSTDELVQYFQSKLGPQRVRLLMTASRQEAEAILDLTKRPEQNIDQLKQVGVRLGLGGGKVQIHPPSFATGVVANVFGRKYSSVKETGRERLREFWSLEDEEEKFQSFLLSRKFNFQKRYAFLWCKKGTIAGEKAHHYTDRRSWANLAVKIAVESDFVPVFTGDDIGLATEPNLTEFWKAWKDTYGVTMTRDQQLGLWAYIAKAMGPGCCAIGMRSGMLEVPALLGIRTLYLEEVENEQRTRMAKWLSVVDTWYRGVMLQPAGLMQHVYWTGMMTKHGSYGGVAKGVKIAPHELKAQWLVSEALRYLRNKDEAVFRKARSLVMSYVGYDIDLPETAMADVAIQTIAAWVKGPSPPSALDGEALARTIIQHALPLAIEGGVQPPAQKESKKPSPEDLKRLKEEKEKKKQEAKSQQPPSASTSLQKKPSPARPSFLPPPPTKYGPKR